MVYYKQKETLIKRLRHCLKWKSQNKLILGSVFRCRGLCLSYLRNSVKVRLLFYVVQTPTKAGYSPFQMSRKYPYLSRVFTMKISARDRFTWFGKYHLALSKGLVREQVMNYRYIQDFYEDSLSWLLELFMFAQVQKDTGLSVALFISVVRIPFTNSIVSNTIPWTFKET